MSANKIKETDDVKAVSLFSLFGYDKYLDRYFTRLAKMGIYTVGHAAEIGGDRLFSECKTTPSTKEKITNTMKDHGIRF